MKITAWKPWTPRLAAFAVGLLLAASMVAWVLRWPAKDAGLGRPLPMVNDDLPPAPAGVLVRLLGAQAQAPEMAAPPDAASRFRLTGIIASVSGAGVALLSIDGNPSKPYPVGSQLEEGWMLQSVERRRVALAADAKAPVGLRLELPVQQP
jgi:general secretion pathway protein C